MRSSGCVSCRIFGCKTHSTPSTQSTSSQQCQDLYQHRTVTLEVLLQTEEQHVSQLEDFMLRTIQPLALMLSASSERQLHWSIPQLDDLLIFHRHFSHILRDSIRTHHRIGAIFLQLAPTLTPIFEAYCYQHAKTLALFNHRKDRIVSLLARIDPGKDGHTAYLQLIKNLSSPLHRLDQYATSLREYYHHLEESHVDRDDAQRAADYYGDLAYSGIQWRKRKEWELNVVHNSLHRMGAETLPSVDDVLAICSVNVLSDAYSANRMVHERIALLYPATLVLLAPLTSQQEYCIESRLQLNQITVRRILDENNLNKRGLKITGPSNQLLIITFPSSIEYQEWCEKLSSLVKNKSSLQHPKLSSRAQQMSKSTSSLNDLLTPSTHRKVLILSKGCLRPHSPLRPRQQGGIGAYSPTSLGSASPVLQPIPGFTDPSANPHEIGSSRPLRRFIAMKKSKPNEFLKRVETSEGDSLLLSVIEAYCIPSHQGGTAIALPSQTPRSIEAPVEHSNASLGLLQSLSRPGLDMGDRRIMINMLNELCRGYRILQEEFDEERRARRKLESQIRTLLMIKSGN